MGKAYRVNSIFYFLTQLAPVGEVLLHEQGFSKLSVLDYNTRLKTYIKRSVRQNIFAGIAIKIGIGKFA
jgi:hypothetical protein